MLVWVIYDISEDKIRNAVVKICKKYGLYRVQKSAFLGELNNNQWDCLAIECEYLIDENDSLYVFPMCEDCYNKIRLIGMSFDRDLIQDRVGTLVL